MRSVPRRAGLEGIVSRLWVLETTPLRRFEKILPQPSVHLIVNLSTPYRLFDRRGQATLVSDAFVSGIQSEYLVIESPSTIHHVGAELVPARLPMITGAAPADLAGRVADARAAWAGVDELVTAVRDAPSAGDALDRFTTFLESSRTLRPADSVVDHTVAAIQADPGQAIGDLAAQAGVSHRTLISRFRAATGITPKAYAQLWQVPRVRECRRRSVAVAGLGRAGHGIRLLRPASRHPRVPPLHRLDARGVLPPGGRIRPGGRELRPPRRPADRGGLSAHASA